MMFIATDIGFSSWDTPIQYRNVKISSDIFIAEKEKKHTSPAHSLVNEPSLSDLLFRIQNQIVYAHRSIVSCASDMLWNNILSAGEVVDVIKTEATDSGKMRNIVALIIIGRSCTITVLNNGISSQSLVDFLLFLYGAKVPFTSNISDLCKIFEVALVSFKL
jgi:hypothetical protein